MVKDGALHRARDTVSASAALRDDPLARNDGLETSS
jgi:hypothetical protein